MVTDYEAAWHELAAVIAGKSQHGREATLTEMAQIAARNRVPAGELSRLLRLYGVEVERARLISTESGRDEPVVSSGGFVSPADAVLPGHHRSEDHDGCSNGRARFDGG